MEKSITKLLFVIFVTLFINAKEVPVKEFNNIIKQNGLVLVELWAPWCGSCAAFKPTYNRVKREFSNKIKFYEINADKVDDPFSKFNIKYGYPSILLYKNGIRVDTKEGGMDYSEMKEWLTQYIK